MKNDEWKKGQKMGKGITECEEAKSKQRRTRNQRQRIKSGQSGLSSFCNHNSMCETKRNRETKKVEK